MAQIRGILLAFGGNTGNRHAIWNHVDISKWPLLKPVVLLQPEDAFMSLAHTCYHWIPCKCPQSVQPLNPFWCPMGHAVTWGHIDVCGLYCHLRPCWCLWSMVLLRVIEEFVVLLQSWSMLMSTVNFAHCFLTSWLSCHMRLFIRSCQDISFSEKKWS